MLHKAGTFSSLVLQAIARNASQRPIAASAETGSGASTLLFSHVSQRHTVFAVDDGTDSIRAVETSPLLRPNVVTFVEGPTQLTLPTHRFVEKLQLVLIDGPHAYPFPDLEYYYLYAHLDEGALLILDDIHIRSITNLFDFLSADDMFDLGEVVENTAFFRRTAAETFSRVGDGWWLQGYNRRDFEATPAVAGVSESLSRSPTATSFYIDELGSIKNPTRRPFLSVAAAEPLLISGWAIDELHQQPAAWIEIVLDGTLYRTEARVARSDVATSKGNGQYLRCGFRTTIPADRLLLGRHTLALRVVLHGGTVYYEGPEMSFAAK